jgi:hypothetical protein
MKAAKSIIPLRLLLLFLVATLATPALVQGKGFSWDDPWKFHVNLYGWLPDAPATIDVGDKTLVDVPEDLDTILDSLEMAAMFELEAHKGPLVLFLNNVYYKGKYDDHFTGRISNQRRKFTLEEKVWAIKYGAGYKFGPWDSESSAAMDLTLIPWVGAFYFNDDWKVKISSAEPAFIFKGIDKDGTLNFNTPMVGLASRVNLTERWYLNLSFGYGGWDVSNVDEIYDFVGNAAYRFKMWNVDSKFLVGYRYLHIDYEDKPVTLEVDVKGPFLGIGWEF